MTLEANTFYQNGSCVANYTGKNKDNTTISFNVDFTITAPAPTTVNASTLIGLLTGYKDNYNATEQIDIGIISSADVKNAFIDILCTNSTNANPYNNSYYN